MHDPEISHLDFNVSFQVLGSSMDTETTEINTCIRSCTGICNVQRDWKIRLLGIIIMSVIVKNKHMVYFKHIQFPTDCVNGFTFM